MEIGVWVVVVVGLSGFLVVVVVVEERREDFTDQLGVER